MQYSYCTFPERTFAGLVKNVQLDNIPCLGEFWDLFFSSKIQGITGIKEPKKFIGLEVYPDNIEEVRSFDYHVLVEVSEIDQLDEYVVRTVPSGKYICFETSLDTLVKDIHASYQYVKDNDIKIEEGFDFEDYMPMDYNDDEVPLRFCLKIAE